MLQTRAAYGTVKQLSVHSEGPTKLSHRVLMQKKAGRHDRLIHEFSISWKEQGETGSVFRQRLPAVCQSPAERRIVCAGNAPAGRRPPARGTGTSELCRDEEAAYKKRGYGNSPACRGGSLLAGNG